MPATPSKRLVFVDALRGLAALAVAFFHFYSQLSTPDSPRWGAFAQYVFSNGDLGVYVFFVLSGFVIACSLHNIRINARVVGKFALRRSVRLDPTYWTVIALTYVVMILQTSLLGWETPNPPGAVDLLANMFYLDNLLGYRSVVAVGWTLCLEIQFYLTYVLLGWLTCAVASSGKPSAWIRVLVFIPLASCAMLTFAGVLPIHQPGLFLPYWFIFFLGVVVWWTLSHEVSAVWLWTVLAARHAWPGKQPAARSGRESRPRWHCTPWAAPAR